MKELHLKWSKHEEEQEEDQEGEVCCHLINGVAEIHIKGHIIRFNATPRLPSDANFVLPYCIEFILPASTSKQ